MRASQSVRDAGVLISTETGSVTSHAAELLADRGVLFVTPGDAVYKGQIVGEHCRDNDLTVNICRLKALSNIRVASKEATVVLKGARKLSLEEAIEYVEDDELVEITPTSVRLRKRLLVRSGLQVEPDVIDVHCNSLAIQFAGSARLLYVSLHGRDPRPVGDHSLLQ